MIFVIHTCNKKIYLGSITIIVIPVPADLEREWGGDTVIGEVMGDY